MKMEDSDKLYTFYETRRFITDLAGFLGERSLDLLYPFKTIC